jgi:hypothetical protein
LCCISSGAQQAFETLVNAKSSGGRSQSGKVAPGKTKAAGAWVLVFVKHFHRKDKSEPKSF